MMSRKIKVLVLSLFVAFFGLTACSNNNEANSNESNGKKVVYVTAGAKGDNGFTDYTAAGIEQIAEDYGAEVRVIESNNDSAKYSQSVEAAFQWNPDIVFADAYGFEELYAQYADRYPEVKVINLDFIIENDEKTITSVTYINEEGSYLAGYLAGKVTLSDLDKANSSKKVGFVGGNDIPVIREFEAGFIQGVKAVDSEIEVISTFVGDFFDPVKGKQAAQQLYAQDVDVIFQAAGQTGSGVLEAAKEADKYAIGVDSNQNGTFPGHIITSMVKDLKNTVVQIYEDIEEGTYEAGQHIEKGAGIGGVYLIFDENSDEILPAELIAELEELQSKIQDGEVEVERYEN